MTMVEASRRVLSLKKPPPSPLQRAVLTGLVFGIVGVYLAAVGVLLMIHGRAIIVGMLSLGQAALVTLGLGTGLFIARRESRHGLAQVVVHSLVAGAVAGGLLAFLLVAMDAFELRPIFIALSPDLQEMLTFGFDVPVGAAILVGAGALLGACGAFLTHLEPVIRKPITVGLVALVVVGVFQELIQLMLPTADWFDPVHDLIYTYDGLTPEGALVIFVVAAGLSALWTWYTQRRGGGGANRDRSKPRHGRENPAGAGARRRVPARGRQLHRPGPHAGRALHSHGDGAQPGSRSRGPSRPRLRRLLRGGRLYDGDFSPRTARTPLPPIRASPASIIGRRCRSPYSRP